MIHRNQIATLIFSLFFLMFLQTAQAETVTQDLLAENTLVLQLKDNGTFVYKGEKPVEAHDGMSLSKEFIHTLSSNTEALYKAQEAKTYSNVAFVGSLSIGVFAVKMLMDTKKKTDQLDNNEIPDNKFEASDLLPLLVASVITVTYSRKAKSTMSEGIEIFNNGASSAYHSSKKSRPTVKYFLGYTNKEGNKLHSSHVLSANVGITF